MGTTDFEKHKSRGTSARRASAMWTSLFIPPPRRLFLPPRGLTPEPGLSYPLDVILRSCSGLWLKGCESLAVRRLPGELRGSTGDASPTRRLCQALGRQVDTVLLHAGHGGKGVGHLRGLGLSDDGHLARRRWLSPLCDALDVLHISIAHWICESRGFGVDEHEAHVVSRCLIPHAEGGARGNHRRHRRGPHFGRMHAQERSYA